MQTLTYYLSQSGVNANKLCVMDGEAVSELESLHAEYVVGGGGGGGGEGEGGGG